MINFNWKSLLIPMAFLGLGLLLVLEPLSNPAVSAAQTPPCNELQIIFLMDQSGSMGGAKAGTTTHPIPNDPGNLRFEAAKAGVALLGPLRYGAHPDATIRVALVNFGSRTEPGFPWTVITPTTESEWTRQQGQFSPALEASVWVTRSLGGTNFVRAFQTAGTLFSQVPAQVGDCPYRAIILLTDGKPEVDLQDDPTFTIAKHFDDLQDYISKNLPRTEIYVAAMSQDAYWTETKSYWLKVAGDDKKIGQVNTRAEVGQRFDALMTGLTNRLPGVTAVEKPVCPGNIPIPPYLQWVSFTLHKEGDPDTDHLVVNDDKGEINEARKDVILSRDGVLGPIERFRVDRPLPGTWRVGTLLPRSTCDLNMVYITAAGKMTAPDPKGDPVVQFTRTPIMFTVGDAIGGPLPDYGQGYDLKIQARVSDVSAVEDLVLTSQPKNVYTASYIPVETGEHRLEVHASTIDTGKVITVVNQPIGTFQVAPAKLALVEGPKGSSVPQYTPITITLAVLDAKKKPVRLDLPATLEVAMVVGNQSLPVKMTEMPDGSFGASYSPLQSGAHRLTYQGTVTLPDGSKETLGGDAMTFNVYETTPLKGVVVRPTQPSFEATDFLGQPTGLIFEVQLVDDKEQPVAPGQVVDGDPMKVFALRVTDSSRRDRSRELVLAPTAQPGLFRAEGKTLGADEFTVDVVPVAKLKQQYAWSANVWTYKYAGSYPLAFFGVVGLGALIGLVVLWSVVGFVRSRPHPFRGTLVITELGSEEEEEEAEGGKQVWSRYLPRSNYVRYANSLLHQDFPPKLNIRSMTVRSESEQDAKEGIVTVDIQTTKGRKGPMKLQRGTAEDAQEIGHRFYIYLR